MPDAPKILTVNELAKYLHVHPSTIYRLLKKGQLPGFRIGSDWRFEIEIIDRWRLKQGSGLPEETASEEESASTKQYESRPGRLIPLRRRRA